MNAPSTVISTEFLMTLHSPLAAPQTGNKDLEIYTALPSGWVRGLLIPGEIIAPTADSLRIAPNAHDQRITQGDGDRQPKPREKRDER
jgi:hypothetical protein